MPESTYSWKCFYTEEPQADSATRNRSGAKRLSNDKNKHPRDPIPSSTPYAILRDEDNKKFCIGDDVLIESETKDRPYIGRIQSFSVDKDGSVEMLSVWYSRAGDIPAKLRRSDLEKVSHCPIEFSQTPFFNF